MIGSKLNVQTVLEGSVRKAGNQLRVTAQLIEVSSGYHLLSRAYGRELKDVFALQEELANAVVTEIMPRVRGERADTVFKVNVADLTAYNLYLKGMVALSRSFSGPRESVEIFQQVLKIDPNYAPASGGLAYAHFLMAWFGIMPSHQAMPRGKAAAEDALRLDPKVAVGHAALGIIKAAFDFDWTGAERCFESAEALQPGLALVFHLHARCLISQGRVAEAVAKIERALELSPFDAVLRATAIPIYGVAGDYTLALQNYSLALEINPNVSFVHLSMGLAHAGEGEIDKAVSAFKTARDVAGSDRSYIALAALGNALARSGDRAGADAIFKEIVAAPWTNSLPLAIVHLGLGHTAEALRWFEQAIEDRDSHVILSAVDPRFAPLRGNAVFEKLLGRMGMASIGAATS